MKLGIDVIADERLRQIVDEKHTYDKDDEYTEEELACAAASYALPAWKRKRVSSDFQPAPQNDAVPPVTWPWNSEHWKPSDDRIRELAKAGALIAAEIDRLGRENHQDDE